MKPIITAIISVIATTAATIAAQAQTETAAILLQRAAVLENDCRGEDINDPKTAKTCCELEQVGLKLNRVGWCYGKGRQIGAEMRWHRCTRESFRHNPQGFCKQPQ